MTIGGLTDLTINKAIKQHSYYERASHHVNDFRAGSMVGGAALEPLAEESITDLGSATNRRCLVNCLAIL